MTTLGQQRVRSSFNPSENDKVAQIKKAAAELIDLCERMKADPEKARWSALAQTSFEEAAMWAVKAATADKA